MSPPSERELRKALKHELRRRLMPVFIAKQPLSPKEAASVLGVPLSAVSYHVTVLVKYRLLVFHSDEPVRGALKRYYVPNEDALKLPLVRDLLCEGPAGSS